MSTIDESLSTLQRELLADPDIAALAREHDTRARTFERESRISTFQSVHARLLALNPDKFPSLYFDTYSPDEDRRQVLIIQQLRNAHQLSGAKILVSDERLNPEHPTRHERVGNYFQLRLVGNLIAQTECRVQQGEGSDWEVGEHGFYLQKRNDEELTYVRHGSRFTTNELRDRPRVSREGLAARHEASEKLLGILDRLVQVEPVPTGYLLTAG